MIVCYVGSKMAGGRGFTLGLMVGVEIPVSPSSAQQELTGTYLTFAHHYHHYHTLLPSLLPRLPQHTTIVQQSFRYSSKHHQSLFFHFKRYSPGPTFLPATRSFYTHFPHLLTNTLLLIFLVACPVLILETQTLRPLPHHTQTYDIISDVISFLN